MEEVHDNAATVNNYITDDLHFLNSNDTWHGVVANIPILLMVESKNVAKSMKIS